MTDFSTSLPPYSFFPQQNDNNQGVAVAANSFLQQPTQQMTPDETMEHKPNDPPPPPPIVICPTEVDHINITLEKNQQCECKDCGKLFNSVWYLKQHAVKHSNDRPFKCKFCFKTYKFRSNLYQHKCPDRQKHVGNNRRGMLNLPANPRRMETNQLLKNKIEANMNGMEEMTNFQNASVSDNEENDIPITYGLLIHRFEDTPSNNLMQQQQLQQSSHQYQQQPQLPSLQSSLLSPTSATLDSILSNDAPFVPRDDISPRPLNCVREQQLPDEEIQMYISENKSKLHTCRKCRLLFPTAASLMRHAAAHSRDDRFPFKCNNCRQAFESEVDLRRHSQLHSGAGPWKCEQCSGVFRSSLALRRHGDQCRQCHIPSEQSDILVSVHSPLDPFSFITSERDHIYAQTSAEKKSPDSGLGSESSPERNSSPERSNPLNHLPADDPYELYGKKKEKEDDEDSGFRSRLNSVTQTCSPGSSSAFSSDGGSPLRKISSGETDHSFAVAGGYGSGPIYGQQLFDHFDSDRMGFICDEKRIHNGPTSLPVP